MSIPKNRLFKPREVTNITKKGYRSIPDCLEYGDCPYCGNNICHRTSIPKCRICGKWVQWPGWHYYVEANEEDIKEEEG